MIISVGLDGHLKLADFGLSKIVESPEQVSEGPIGYSNPMNISSDSYLKLLKFFPLKLNLAEPKMIAKHCPNILMVRADGDLVKSCKQNANNGVKFVFIDSKGDDRTSSIKFDAIFVDIDPTNDVSTSWDPYSDGLELIDHFCSVLFNGAVVYVLTSSGTSLIDACIQRGAKRCFTKPVDLPFLRDAVYRNVVVEDSIDTSSFASQNKACHPNATPGGIFVGTDDIDDASNLFPIEYPKINYKKSGVEKRQHHSVVGTIHFLAPEVVQSQKYGKSVDWWAVGVTMYECVVRDHIFSGEKKDVILDKIVNQPIDLNRLIQSGPAIHNLVEGLLCRNINNRLGAQGSDHIKSHEFFRDIQWHRLSDEEPLYKPKQFKTKKFSKKDKVLFYGEKEEVVEELPLSLPDHFLPSEQFQRDFGVIKKYRMNRIRLQKSRRGIDRSNVQHTPKYSHDIEKRRRKLVGGETLPLNDSQSRKSSRDRSLSFSFSNEVCILPF